MHIDAEKETGDINPHTDTPWVCYGLIAIYLVGSLWLAFVLFQPDSPKFYPFDVLPKRYGFFVAEGQSVHAMDLFVKATESLFWYTNPFVLILAISILRLFGDNVEYAMGRMRFVLFYLITGYISIYATFVINGASVVPLSAAIGALWAVIGAYIRIFPEVRVIVRRRILPNSHENVKVYVIGWFLTYTFFFWVLSGLTGLKDFVILQLMGFVLGYALAELFRNPKISVINEDKPLRN